MTVKADKGYYLTSLGLIVNNGEQIIDIDDCLWYTGKTTATFKMPAANVQLYPLFTNSKDLTAKMPSSGTKDVYFPTDNAAINIHNDYGYFGAKPVITSEGSFVHVKSPGDNYAIRIRGGGSLRAGDILRIYDGADTNAPILYEKGQDTEFNGEISIENSVGKDLLVQATCNSDNNFEGNFSLLCSAIDPTRLYKINIADSKNGFIEIDKSSVKADDKVTITVKPNEGYLLENIRFKDLAEANYNLYVQPLDYSWYDGTNKLTFAMPASDIEIEPIFLTEASNPELYKVTMPTEGTQNVTIPQGLQQFRIICGKGMNGFGDNANGTICITASKGDSFLLRGDFQGDGNYLKIYDGLTTDSKLLYPQSEDESSKGSIDISTTNNNVLLKFDSNGDDKTSYVNLILELKEGLKGEGTAANPYILKTEEQWDAFVKKVNSGEKSNACAKMLKDITTNVSDETASEKFVGTKDHPYSGTFDGNGHTLRYYSPYFSSVMDLAPFCWVDGAYIKQLYTDGYLQSNESSNSYVGGLVAHAVGAKSTIERCKVNTDLEGKTSGGVVADAQAPLDIEDCFVKARFKSNDINSTVCGGFVGNADAAVTISNCLSMALFNEGSKENNFIFSGSPEKTTISNSYYFLYNTENVTSQGEQLAYDDFGSLGNIVSKLQNNRTDGPHWIQDARSSYWYSGTTGAYPDPEPYIDSKDEQDEKYYLYYNVEKGGWYVGEYENNSFENLDNSSYKLNPYLDFMAGNVIFKSRSFTGTTDNPKINTLCLPFDVNPSEQNIKAYELTTFDDTDKSVVFKHVSSIQAAKPYLIEVTSDNTNINITDATVYSKPAESTTANGVTMTGNYSFQDIFALDGKGIYILQSDNLWHPVVKGDNNGDVNIKASRAYLTFNDKDGAKPLNIKFIEDGTTGINNIKTVDNDGTVVYYDLNGRYIGTSLNEAAKGIYITSNGRKVLK